MNVPATEFRTLVAAVAVSMTVAAPACAQLDKLLDVTKGVLQNQGAAAALSDSEVGSGLKEALAQGVESAVSSLGRTDGFLANEAVKIALPDSFRTVEKGLRVLGKGEYADSFIESMNRAAETAVPEASGILGDAIRQMSIKDAQSILSGPEDAATQYFRKVGEERLFDKLLPIVRVSTDKAGVTSSYKNMLERAGPAASLIKSDATDIDGYVTNKTLDGLFEMIAREEAEIRANPAARGTDLLKKVFAK